MIRNHFTVCLNYGLCRFYILGYTVKTIVSLCRAINTHNFFDTLLQLRQNMLIHSSILYHFKDNTQIVIWETMTQVRLYVDL